MWCISFASEPEDLKGDPDVREAALASERYALLNAVKAGKESVRSDVEKGKTPHNRR